MNIDTWGHQDRSLNLGTFTYAMNVVLMFLTVTCQAGMISRRKRFPLSGRNLVISFYLAFAFIITESLTILKQTTKGCTILYYISAAKHMAALPITLEAWHLLMRRKILKNVEEMKTETLQPRISLKEGFFLRNIWLMKDPFLIFICTTWNIWHLSVPLFARFYHGQFDCPRGPAFNLAYSLSALTTMPTLSLNLLFAYVLSGEPGDAFLLRQDLLAISWMGVFVMVFGMGMFSFFPAQYAYYRLDEIVGTTAVGFITWRYNVSPLYRSFGSPDPKKLGPITPAERLDFERILTDDFRNFYNHMRGELAVEELKFWQALHSFNHLKIEKIGYAKTIFNDFIKPNRIAIPNHVSMKIINAIEKNNDDIDAAMHLAQRELFDQLFREHYHRYKAERLLPQVRADNEDGNHGSRNNGSQHITIDRDSRSFEVKSQSKSSGYGYQVPVPLSNLPCASIILGLVLIIVVGILLYVILVNSS